MVSVELSSECVFLLSSEAVVYNPSGIASIWGIPAFIAGIGHPWNNVEKVAGA